MSMTFRMSEAGFTPIYHYLKNVMNDCKKAGLPLLILDRVNPLSGKVEGNILKEEYFSYVGCFSLPQRYGLTVGEVARLFDSEIGLKDIYIPWRY